MRVRAGTRKSRLARWQTDQVLQRLQATWGNGVYEAVTFDTKGDRILDKPLPSIGGKGLFTAELETALRDGHIDLAVHSLKDLPTESVAGITLGAILSRADVRDALVGPEGLTLETLPEAAIVGTSSHRRAAQLLRLRPDIIVRSIRGNVPTRVRKVEDGQYDAAIMAASGLQRLGLEAAIAAYLPVEIMMPAPGQAALAVQCRANDNRMLDVLAAIDDADVRKATTAERTFLASLGAGCSMPLAAYATVSETGSLHMSGLVASLDGQQVIRVEGTAIDPVALGTRLAEEARGQGALEVMAHGN